MYRTLPNGDLFVPRRGNVPPPCPDGYVRDGGDSWIFHWDHKPCQHRRDVPDPSCNCKTKIVLWCDYVNQQIKLGQCKECTWASPKSCIQSTTTRT